MSFPPETLYKLAYNMLILTGPLDYRLGLEPQGKESLFVMSIPQMKIFIAAPRVDAGQLKIDCMSFLLTFIKDD